MISLIAAVAENGVIGNEGKIPWYLPEDFKHFKETTSGQIVVMGRKTWDSLPEKLRPLPNRHNIVVSRSMEPVEGIEVARSYEEAIEKAHNKEIFIIGGNSLYKESMEKNADRLIISHVKMSPEGDTHFPEISNKIWKPISEKDHEQFKIVVYEKI